MPRPRKSTYGNEKPPYSYVALCAMAIQNSTAGMLTLNEIYRFITNSFPFYKANPSKWRNSLRHNLSFNDCFVKIICATNNGSKKSYWSLHPSCGNMFKDGSLLRRRRRFVTGKDREAQETYAWEKGVKQGIDKGIHTGKGTFETSCGEQSPDRAEMAYRTITTRKKTDFTIDSILKRPAKEEADTISNSAILIGSQDANRKRFTVPQNDCSIGSSLKKRHPAVMQPEMCRYLESIAANKCVYFDGVFHDDLSYRISDHLYHMHSQESSGCYRCSHRSLLMHAK